MKPARKPKGYYGSEPIKEAEGTGGIVASEKSMKPAVRVPCVECPLRRDSMPGYLGGYTPEMYLEVMHSPASIACHASGGFHEGDIERQHHCTGVAAYRANVGWIASVVAPRGRMGIVPTAAHESTRLIGHNETDFFASPREFVEHHAPGQRRTPRKDQT